jgi:hypothetical protein
MRCHRRDHRNSAHCQNTDKANDDGLSSSDDDADFASATSWQADKRYQQLEDNFRRWYNGDLRSKTPTHFRGIGDGSDDDIVNEMVQAGRSFLLSRMPTVPQPSKWTKLGPCVAFIIRAWLVHFFLPAVNHIAFKEITFAEWDPTEEYKLVEELQFSKIAGSRCKKNQEFLDNGLARFRIIILGIIMEAIRLMTFFFIASARTVQDPTKLPKLLDVLNPKYSVLVTVQQYFASLLCCTGLPSRLTLLAGALSFESIPDWVHACYGTTDSTMRLVRRSVLLTAGWVHRRHTVPFSEEPWSLCILVDDRAPPELKTAVLESFDRKHSCCVRPGLTFILKQRGVTSSELQTTRIPEFWELSEVIVHRFRWGDFL